MLQFEINVTNVCPAKCYDCIASDYKPADEVILTVLQASKRYDEVLVWATGGEPMIRPDFVESLLKTKVGVQLVTTGLYNTDIVVSLLRQYNNAHRVNVSILGDPKSEQGIRKVEGNFRREWLWKLPRQRVNIIFVVFKDMIQTGKAFEGIKYVLENYGYFPVCILYDRFEKFTQDELVNFGGYAKELSSKFGVELMVYPERLMHPTVFVSGKELCYYYGKCLSKLDSAVALMDMDGFIDTVYTGHKLNRVDALVNCKTYKLYRGCGGPGCRYGYIPECESFWSQFIEPSVVVNTVGRLI